MDSRHVPTGAQSALIFQLLYFSQMTRFHYQTFRELFFGSPKMISYVKDDPFIQVTSQEPLMSSKFFFIKIYPHNPKIKKMAITPLKIAEMTWLCRAGWFFGWFWWGLFSWLFWFGDFFSENVFFCFGTF